METKNVIVQEGDKIFIKKVIISEGLDHVPAAVYEIGLDKENGPFIVRLRDKFDVPAIVYGDTEENTKILLADYTRNKRTSSFFVGDKGMGKTMGIEHAANRFIGLGLPVVRISKPLPIDLIAWVMTMTGPCVYIFEEFSKMYTEHRKENLPCQLDLLPILSDSSIKNNVVLFSDNSHADLSQYLVKRPQRIKFWFDFRSGIDQDTIRKIFTDRKAAKIITEFMVSDVVSSQDLTYDDWMNLADLASDCETIREFCTRVSYYNTHRFTVQVISLAFFTKTAEIQDHGKIPLYRIKWLGEQEIEVEIKGGEVFNINIAGLTVAEVQTVYDIGDGYFFQLTPYLEQVQRNRTGYISNKVNELSFLREDFDFQNWKKAMMCFEDHTETGERILKFNPNVGRGNVVSSMQNIIQEPSILHAQLSRKHMMQR